jgi:hypothetical protein
MIEEKIPRIFRQTNCTSGATPSRSMWCSSTANPGADLGQVGATIMTRRIVYYQVAPDGRKAGATGMADMLAGAHICFSEYTV